MGRVGSAVIARPWVVVGVVALIAAAWWGVGTRSQDHHVNVTFDSAINLAPGMDVQAAGVDVGKVAEVKYENGEANVKLGIDDGAAWPLRRGTVAAIRLGSTAGNGNRRVELTPGPESAPEIPDGGSIGRGVAPVELDEVLNVFRAPTRRQLGRLMDTMSTALDGNSKGLNEGLGELDGSLRATGSVMRDLADSEDSLKRLLTDGAQVTRALAGRRERIASLVNVTAQTFDVFARNSKATQDTIAAAPATFQQAQRTLARVDPSLDGLQDLLTDLQPGVRRLPELARTAAPALRRLRSVGENGAALADTAARTAPAVTTLLRRGTPLASTLGAVVKESQPIAECLTPYVPNLASLVTVWAGWTQEYDNVSHLARARIMEGATTVQENPIGTELTDKATPLNYNGIPAPGFFVGKPRFNEECGVGAAEVDAANDWERDK